MTNPNNKNKDAARRLAELLSNENRVDILKTILELKHLNSTDIRDNDLEHPIHNVDLSVGIWKPVERDGDMHFVRSPDVKQWPGAWSEHESIPPKSGTRIVLLGESVARGMHTDPFFSPAQVLEDYLNKNSIDGSFEVVDLARIDATMDYLLRTMPLSIQLDPDMIVIFAGNNWKNDPSVMESENHFRTRSRPTNIRFLKDRRRFRDERLGMLVDNYVDLITRCKALAKIPIVHVLPEFNLFDWRPSHLNVCPLPPGNGNTRWYAVYEKLKKSIDDRRTDKVETLAKELMALDEGLSPSGPYFLGQQLREQGEISNARHYLEMAMDFTTVPRCTSLVQSRLRLAAQQNKIILIDLPKLLASDANHLLPDRKQFLDYCHFTVEGVLAAVKLISGQLTPLLHKPELRKDGDLNKLQPNNHIQACSHFCGALYNGRFDQPYEIIRYHASRALELSPAIIEDMLAFLAHNTTSLSKGLNPAYLSGRGTPIHAIQSRLSIPKANWSMIRALSDAMTASNASGMISTQIGNMLEHQFDVTKQSSTNILESHFWSRNGQSYHDGRWYHQCCTPEFCLEFYVGSYTSISIDLTLRCAAPGAENESIVIAINNVKIATIAGLSKWQKVDKAISIQHLKMGVNQLKIAWPRLGLSLTNSDPRPIWGSVYSITIRPAVTDQAEVHGENRL